MSGKAFHGDIGQIFAAPDVLHALNPWWAVHFFLTHGQNGIFIFGAVVLAVTGGVAAAAQGTRFIGGTTLWFAEHAGANTICVTGTKGKSTTSALLAHLLRAGGHRTALTGNTPVLAISGEYDPVTPPRYGDEAIAKPMSKIQPAFADCLPDLLK